MMAIDLADTPIGSEPVGESCSRDGDKKYDPIGLNQRTGALSKGAIIRSLTNSSHLTNASACNLTASLAITRTVYSMQLTIL